VQIDGIVPRGTREAVFNQMFWVFTALGAVVGVVVIGYLLWKAYQYRASKEVADDADIARPQLGKLPSSSHGGRHLLFSFSISAIIVLSLIAWTYGSLLYLEQGVHQNPPADVQERMDVTVVGHQFYWEFKYHNVSGHNRTVTTSGKLRVPKGALVTLRVTSADVFHNFGIPAMKVKTDAIPGQTTTTWFIADQRGTYLARCYELCGRGHSYMTAKVVVMRPNAFNEWYANQTSTNSTMG
ncbi:MAG: cytochrome c oxidase subunit II, partial [Halobacteriaceae archaeon]